MSDYILMERDGHRPAAVVPEQFQRDTERWREATAEILMHVETISQHPAPPTKGEQWDALIASYRAMRKLIEAVSLEATGINLTYGQARVNQLARDLGITQAHISRQKKRWDENRPSTALIDDLHQRVTKWTPFNQEE